MIAKSRFVAAALFVTLASPALAADPARSAMAGDPNWPGVAEVAPAIAMHQGPGTPAATEVDATAPAAAVPAGIALVQARLRGDPLQGDTDAVRFAAAPPGAPKQGQEMACTSSCACHHG